MSDPHTNEPRPTTATAGTDTRLHETRLDTGGTSTKGGGGDGRRPPAKWLAVAGGVLALTALLGYELTPAKPTMEVTVITTVPEMQAAILNMDINPAQKQVLMQQAQAQEIEILNFAILQTSNAGQTYDVATDIKDHAYTLQAQTQSFSLPITRQATTFTFSALRTSPGAAMTGIWHTAVGNVPYDMTPGQTTRVRLK